jgi:hypothetical protein
LFQNNIVIDVFGDINVDGSGEPWEYMDGWAYRKDNTGPDGITFVIENWTFSSINALDGETSNSTASTPYPIKTFNTDDSLPIELSEFSGTYKSGVVELRWTTESEINNLGFNLYKSEIENGIFEKVGEFIEGAGNSSNKNNYSFTDPEVIAGHTYYYQLEDVSTNGKTKKHSIKSITISETNGLISEFKLMPAYPNPCNPVTHIKFNVPKQSMITLNIYNLQGKLIRSLVSDTKTQGNYEVKWNGTNSNDQPVGNGVYLYQLTSSTGYSKTEKIILLK